MGIYSPSEVADEAAGAPEIEITPAMIEAGFQALAASGLGGDDLLEADRLTVVDIFRAMYLASRPCAPGET